MKQITSVNTKVTVLNHYGKKEIIPFIFPDIVETKEDNCIVHKLAYTNICHRLPSNNFHWEGCPKCKILVDKKRNEEYVTQHVKKCQSDISLKSKEEPVKSLKPRGGY